MYKVKLFNMPEDTRILEDKGCIDLYAQDDVILESGRVRFLNIGNCSYEIGEGIIGYPFLKSKSTYKLYHPKGFHFKHDNKMKISLKSSKDYIIKKGEYLASIKFMTTQFFNLMQKKDNSDKGLRSAYIKIECYETNKESQ